MWALAPIMCARIWCCGGPLATHRCVRRLRSKVCVGMLLDADQVADVQTDCFAEDIDPPDPLPSWTKDQWVAFFESGGEEAAAVQVLAPKQRISPARYEVVHTTCFVRASPDVSAKAVGQHPCGTVVEVDEVRDGWALLSDTSEPQRTTSPTGECWMLIDGRTIGLGQLLQPLPPQLVRRRPRCPHCMRQTTRARRVRLQPAASTGCTRGRCWPGSEHPPLPAAVQSPAAIAAFLAARADLVRFLAPVTYEVVAPLLFAYELPDESSRRLGEPFESGARVLIQGCCDGWVQLASDHGSQLSYGAAAACASWLRDGGGADPTVRVAEKRLPASTVWPVTRTTACLGYQAPGGRGQGKPIDALINGHRVEVDAECGHWVRLKGTTHPVWVELDAFLAG